jgi:hypothetical protein
MFDTSSMEELPSWRVYREVAAQLDGTALIAWRRFYETHPARDVLLGVAACILDAVSRPPVIAR